MGLWNDGVLPGKDMGPVEVLWDRDIMGWIYVTGST